MTESPTSGLLERIRSEYLEMPGLRLTLAQIQKLCGAERAPCRLILDALVDARFLCKKPDGTYARPTDGASRPLRLATSRLRSDAHTVKAS